MATTATTTPDRRLSDALLNRLAREARERADARVHRQLNPVSQPGLIVQRDGRALVNLSSNDYLGLSQHPHLVAAVRVAAERFGVGSGASPLAGGHTLACRDLERRAASLKHAEAAVLLPTGFAANLALLTTLARPGDLVASDSLNHASLIDAAKLSGATLRTYPHVNVNDHQGLAKLDRLLSRHADDAPDAARFIVTDAVFSMDGDVTDLPALADLAERHDAHLIVDEAHATGLLGPTGAGLIEAQRVADRVAAANSTASKALGSLGGLVTGPTAVIDAVINRARPLIYSTAPPPTQVAAIAAALDVVADEPHRRHRVIELARRVRSALGLPAPTDALLTPIVPLIVGAADAAMQLSQHLADAGFLAPAIRPPTVKPGRSRVRLSLRADLTDNHVDRLIQALADADLPRLG